MVNRDMVWKLGQRFCSMFLFMLCRLAHAHGEDNEFQHNEAINQQRSLAESLNRIAEILIDKILKDLCTVKELQHNVVAHCKRFEICRVSRPCLH